MSLKNYFNKITDSDRIYTREDIGNMSSNEYTKNEKAINYQLKSIGIPTNSQLGNSSDVVYVSAYTRKDGTEVRAYYRSKGGRTTFLPQDDEGNNKSDNPTNQDKKAEDFMQNPLYSILDSIFNPSSEIFIPDDYPDSQRRVPESQYPSYDTSISDDVKETMEQYKLLIQIGAGVVGGLAELVPDDWDFKPIVTGITLPIQGLMMQMADFVEATIDPEAAREKAEEMFKEKIEKAVNALGECVSEMVNGHFKDIDWVQTLKDIGVDEIAGLINPIAGAVATLAIDVSPALIDAVKVSKDGNKQEMIQDIMDAVTSGFGPITQLSGALGEKIGDLKDIAERNKAIEMYGDLKELSQSQYRYEKLVSAELYTKATNEISKIRTLANKFTYAAKNVLSKLKISKNKGFATGAASDLKQVNHNAPLPKADFSEYKKGNILKKINEEKNAYRPDAKEFMNISIVGPQNAPKSLEYTIVGPDFNKKLNSHFDLGSAKIDKKWPGVIYNENSSISYNLSNSPQLQAQVKENFKNNQFKSGKILVGLDEDENLHYSIGHGTILNPKIENGYFKGVLFDKYDYKWDFTPLWKYNETTSLNNKAYVLQRFDYLKNYYVLVPIKFKW